MSEIRPFGANAGEDLLGDLLAVHSAVHGPPDTPGGFGAVLETHLGRDGFAGALAERDDRVIGFGYGYDGDPEGALAGFLDPAWSRCSELAQLAVLPSEQGRGIGAALVGEVMGALGCDRVVLTVMEGNDRALGLYRGLGWFEIGHGFVSPSGHGPYLVMGFYRTG